MSIFFTLLGKILPLYFSIILGVISTAFLNCNKDTIAKILLPLKGFDKLIKGWKNDRRYI